MPARPQKLVLFAIVVIALAFRIPGMLEPSLWFDEVYGATFATQGPIDTVIAALRFDIHPPLYYLQLSIWGLLGNSDLWLYGNALAYSLGAIVILYLAATRFFDQRVGAIAAGLMALSPPDILYAQSVRMYSMVILLSILCWACNHRLAHGATGWRSSLLLIIVALTLAYSHVLGFYMSSFFGLYSLLEMRRTRSTQSASGTGGSPFLSWCRIYALLGLLMLPAAGNALMRSAAHAAKPDAIRVLTDVTFLFVGPEGATLTIGRVLAGIIALALVITAVRVPRSRPTIVGLIFAPCAVMLMASYLVDPMWNRRIVAFVQPFIGLALGLGVVALGERWAGSRQAGKGAAFEWPSVAIPLGTLAVVFGVFAALHILRGAKEQNFRAAATAIRNELPAGGTVFVPNFVDFWAINRYLIGPEWGSPLVVQANEDSERWESIIKKLGNERCEQLGLIGETTRLANELYDIVVGPRFDPDAIEKGPVLLVHSGKLPEEDLARLTMFEPFSAGTEVRGLMFGRLRKDKASERLRRPPPR